MEYQGHPEHVLSSAHTDQAATNAASFPHHSMASHACGDHYSSPAHRSARGRPSSLARRGSIILLLFLSGLSLLASEPSAEPGFNVRNYVVNGGGALSSNTVNSILSKYTGTSISLEELASAAADLRSAYGQAGYTNLSVAIAQDRITNGVVTMNLFRALVPQVFISGKRYTNASSTFSLASSTKSAPAPNPGKTNAPPGFLVRAYEITGDTLLSTNTLMSIFAKRTGTNVTINDILQAATDLQAEYRSRGYPTVVVSVPQQTISNAMVKIRVFQGRISNVRVANNHYFSSNNVMRALPSLQTNTILNGPIFQAELDQANQNQDRQIYGELQPGPVPNTTDLILNVKDRLPLHAKFEFNNQSSPGTPILRLNSSATYNNLWQLEHSIGVQYSFSPETYKPKDRWPFYDLPLVANYSGFYRMPLGDLEPVEASIAAEPGSFGYDEATRKFRLPPSSGRPELNFYASRSTIDTGLEQFPAEQIYNVPGVRQVFRQDVQDDVTINSALGFRLSHPVPQFEGIRSTISAGLDYKIYDLTSTKTNVFNFTEITLNSAGQPNPPVISSVFSPIPTTERTVTYIPFTFRWDATRPDKHGSTTFGLGYSPNFLGGLYSDVAKFHNVAGSSKANGYYHILTPSLIRDQVLYEEWRLGVRLDGQWANQPLISNEQFGIGGLNGVRGYREGEVFADTGWRVTSELKTPPHVVGTVYGRNPLVVRGSIFMDYAEGYLLDPNGRNDRIPLWGTGFGGVATIGPHWEGRLLFSWPLSATATTEAGQPRFDFGLSFQF
jgi:hemolysin activation/secretion protein